MPQTPGCTRCPLYQTTTRVCVWGDGNPDAKIMLIGEAPGANEEKEGRPFIGDAGRVLDRALAEAGLKREDVYISNAVKCRPPANRTPTAAEIKACLPYLIEEIDTIQPTAIVALGGSAIRVFTGSDKVGAQRGKTLTSKIDTEAHVLATYHPAAALYNDGGSRGDVIEGMITADLRKANALISDAGHEHDVRLTFPLGQPDGIEDLDGAPAITVDLEWTAGESVKDVIWPWSNRGEVYSLSMTGHVGNRYITRVFGFPLSDASREAIHARLSSKMSIFHNGISDLQWLASLRFGGIRYSGDSMILAHLVDETQPLNLEDLAVKYGNVRPGWKGHLFRQRPGTEQEWREILTYNGEDTYAGLRCWEGLVAYIKTLSPERREAIMRLHNQIMIPATKALTAASYSGVPIDIHALDMAARETEARRNEAAERLAESVSMTPLDAAKLASSPEKTVTYLRHNYGLDISDAQKATLEDYIDCEAVEIILDWKAESKLLSTYFKPWRSLLKRQGDGRLHSMYKPVGTRTGRTSAEGEGGGTLQTTPHADWVRALVRAVDGRKIVGADFSQIELKTIAWISDEPTMLQLYREGDDLHRATAAYIIATGELGAPPPLSEFWPNRYEWYEKVTKEGRQGAKGANFGLAYGMQEDKFRRYAKSQFKVTLTAEQAHLMHRSYFALYSRLEPWHEEIMGFARRTGHVSTPFGRWLSIPQDQIHVAINTPIQSAANDLTMMSMGVVFERIKQERLRALIIGNIHDSILLDVHDDDAERAAFILKDSMENLDTKPFGFTLPIPIVADIKVGQSWAA